MAITPESTAEYKITIKPMLEAAAKAAHIALKRRKKGVTKGTKPDQSFITNGDYQSQQMIEHVLGLDTNQNRIAAAFGETKIDFIGEENLKGEKHDLSTVNQGLKWVVDPIDGTYGYSQDKNSNETHPWAISIALVHKGETVASVIYEAAPNEYGNTEKDHQSIDPTKPSGTFYWAHKNIEGAHTVKGLSVNLPVGDHTRLYAQENNPFTDGITLSDQQKPLQFLAHHTLHSLYESLTVNDKNATKSIIDPTLVTDKAPAQLDAIAQDGGSQNGSHKEIIKQAARNVTSVEPIDSMSAVASAMQAATGRTPLSLAARGWDWDHKGAELILEKSKTRYKKYALPDADNEYRTMLIAGRDDRVFDAVDATINSMRTKDGQPSIDKKDSQIVGDAVQEYIPGERSAFASVKNVVFGAVNRAMPGLFSKENPSGLSR